MHSVLPHFMNTDFRDDKIIPGYLIAGHAGVWYRVLTYWGWGKMAVLLLTTFCLLERQCILGQISLKYVSQDVTNRKA